ncbi:MAG: UvrD-helicase domain-containing protein [Bacilli bacterium]|nr:UvrD-helicase domain-containing protein [Bacilli bacterium]
MDYEKLLNDKQYQAVSTTSKYVRVVAGAGSGKTRTLTYRIAYLIGELGYRPSSLLAITFTNKAAGEMKERAVNLVPQAKGHLQISTFHSFCARFLRQEIDNIGYSIDFQIIDDEDQEKMIKDIAVKLGKKKNDPIVKSSLSFIAHYKCSGVYPEDVILKKHHAPEDEECLKIYHLYEDEKDKMNKVDFDDLLLKTIIVLEECPSVREKWQRKFSNILIDEFQDTNDVQFKLVKLLMNETTNLYVVGDPDQTIYTWRGANQDIILKYELTFPGAETIILNENYRSTQNILDCANKLIAYNKKRVPKDLFTSNAGGDKVQYQSCFSRETEASNIASKIEILKRINHNFKYSDVLILYRALYLTQPVEKAFMAKRLPYKIYGGVKFFQRKEIKDVLAYFNLIYNPKDDLSFKRIVNVPKREIGDKTLSNLEAEKDDAKLSFYEYVSNIQNYDTLLKTKHILALNTLIEKIEAVKVKLNEKLEAYPTILQAFIEDIGYYDYLKEDEEEGEDRFKNVQSLFDDILNFVKNNPDSDFQAYLENAALQTSQDEVDDGEHVSFMTVHIAKGLEYKYVFVIGLNQGVFPSDRTTMESGDDGLEEERRLCYVAFTRAKEHLYISSNKSYSYILGSEGTESQFIKEAGLSKEIPYQQTNRSYQTPPTPKKFSFDFLEQGEEISIPKPQENGIKDWRVGDKVTHDKFGKGVVTSIIDDTIIQIDFETAGRKSILSNHKMLHRDQGGFDA